MRPRIDWHTAGRANLRRVSDSCRMPSDEHHRDHEHAARALGPFGWNARVAALAASATADGEPGRVVRVDRGASIVQLASATEPVAIATDQGARADIVPVVGDWVVVTTIDVASAELGIAEVLPRWSSITRADPSGSGQQVLVANIDLVVIVQGLDRPMKPGRIERSLAMAWESGATPVVVLTKADLAPDPQPVVDEVRSLARGVEVIVTSATDRRGLDAVRALAADQRTMVLLGESGAGKSTLVNALVGSSVLETGAVREGDAKGRHTTTHREMVVLDSGGVVIDTPGLRSLGLNEAGEGVDLTFPEIEERAEHCKFRDCRHRAEPGCAVRAGVTDGAIPPERLARYLALQDELEELADRASLDYERKRQGRIGAKALRRHQRDHPKDPPAR